jgi:hypothetical protein
LTISLGDPYFIFVGNLLFSMISSPKLC